MEVLKMLSQSNNEFRLTIVNILASRKFCLAEEKKEENLFDSSNLLL